MTCSSIPVSCIIRIVFSGSCSREPVNSLNVRSTARIDYVRVADHLLSQPLLQALTTMARLRPLDMELRPVGAAHFRIEYSVKLTATNVCLGRRLLVGPVRP